MTQNQKIPDRIKVAIVSYLSGQWDTCDASDLNAWLEEDEQNSDLFSRLVDIWEVNHMLQREKSIDVDRAWQKMEQQMDIQNWLAGRVKRLSPVVRYAAVIVLAVLFGAVGYQLLHRQMQWSSMAGNWIEYTTPYGSQTNLKLADGTQIWLNAGTTIQYNEDFGRMNRNVKLSGEAFFHVAKNKQLPFVVNARSVSVEALGTEFNVKAYPEEIQVETILMEGSVAVNKGIAFGENRQVILTPGEKAVYNSDDGELSVLTTNGSSEVSWFKDEWVIEKTNLEGIAKLLQRRYDVEFEFTDDRLKTYELRLTITDETLEQVLTAITYLAPINYKLNENEVLLTINPEELKKYEKLLK